MKLNPNDLGNFVTVEQCQKIQIDAFIREVNKRLKLSLLQAELEGNCLAIELCTTKTRFNGEKYWFICPSCHHRRGTLYKHPLSSEIACRECLNISYKKQRYKGMF